MRVVSEALGAPGRQALRGWRRASLAAIKTVHTIAFFGIGSCLGYFAYSGLARRSDRRAAIAGVVVTGEALVYALNGFRCPLTDLAERLGSERGSVADIYLPHWIEAHLPEITGPIFAGAVMSHARNILESGRGRPAKVAPQVVKARRGLMSSAASAHQAGRAHHTQQAVQVVTNPALVRTTLGPRTRQAGRPYAERPVDRQPGRERRCQTGSLQTGSLTNEERSTT